MRLWLLALLLSSPPLADGERDNQPDNVRKIPPPGVAVPEADRADLTGILEMLGKDIAALRVELKGKPALLDLIPDVQIYHTAVRYALTYNEIFHLKELNVARSLLHQGLERAKALREGKPAWPTATGLVVRGYVSKIDGSVQPYGLVVPASYRPGGLPHRLDTWFHGRGETLSELNFIDQRQRSPGEFTPRDAFVLHLYGRYCNANKLAGEVDLFEALDDVKKRYPIDENRIVVRGFSMGGAACWQFAVHYPGLWAAAAPGAGFSETPDFLKVFQNETVKPTPWEQKLWHMYDCTDYAINLFNCPTVAYSGEDDKQKQAADIMAKALAAEGIELTHIIGPKTGHKYHPAAKEEINRRIDSIVAFGRDQRPPKIHFTTWTLRYNEMGWVRLDGLGRHWERARVFAELKGWSSVNLKTENVTALTLSFPPGLGPFLVTERPKVTIDTWILETPPPQSDRSWKVHLRKVDGNWSVVDSPDDETVRKRPGLQGPIDDAFLDSFVMVKPTGAPLNEKVGAWAAKEMEHAVAHWRQQFRGDARVTTDDAVGDAEIASSNLVLWGDPSSNRILAKILPKLPIAWDGQRLVVAGQSYASETHVPVLVFPNPLNPKRYVVLNSGFTFREYDYLNNARQVPKLPDWAVLDITVPPNSRYPGKVVTADFFDEKWEIPK